MARKFHLIVVGMVAAMAAGLASSANAESSAGGTYRLHAYVPVACWVRAQGPVMAQTGQAGSVVEACNAPGGFTVSASYRPLTAHESARLVYGDRMLNLANSGQQVLRHSNMATIRTVDYRFDDVQLDAPLILALTIQPI
jgi:hypothetical protein